MERKQRIMMISVICVVICVILAVILVMVIPKPEEQEEAKPWWEQDDKILIVLEDERSIEKIVHFKPHGIRDKIEFNYIEDKKDPKECIPKVTVYYEGMEQEVFINVVNRRIFNVNQNNYNSIAMIRNIGIHLVDIGLYLNAEDAANMKNEIDGITINIVIRDGIEG